MVVVIKVQSMMKEKPQDRIVACVLDLKMGFSKVLLITLVMMMIRMMMMATMIVACVRDPRIGFSKVLSSRSSHTYRPSAHRSKSSDLTLFKITNISMSETNFENR